MFTISFAENYKTNKWKVMKKETNELIEFAEKLGNFKFIIKLLMTDFSISFQKYLFSRLWTDHGSACCTNEISQNWWCGICCIKSLRSV